MAEMELLQNIDGLGSGLAVAGQNAGQAVWLVLAIVLSVAALGGAIWFVVWFTSFKHKVVIREITGRDGHYLMLEDRAKRRIRGGSEFWKLRRRRALVPAPPSEAIQVTHKGRYYAECAHHEKSGLDSGYTWITPSKDPLSGDYVINQTQEERALLADRLRRAADRKSMRTIDAIMQFAGMFFVLVIVISILAFFGDISQNVNQASKETAVVLQRVQEVSKNQADFQEQLNAMLATMECSPPAPVNQDLPLDQQV